MERVNGQCDLPLCGNEEGTFQCPGESRPITKSVHLARLASGYAPCRDCGHRSELGLLPRHVARRTERRVAQPDPPLLTADGIRGLYLNTLTREALSLIVQHVLDLVDAERLQAAVAAGSSVGALRIVVGYDSRPSSPELALGVVTVLRRWGCHIADLGTTSRPAFDFALQRLHPHAGLFVTGGLRPRAWNGLDVVGPTGIPWCFPGRLSALRQQLNERPARTSRWQGKYEIVHLAAEYEAALIQHFHAIRPLRLGISCPDPTVQRTLHALLERTPCQVHFLNGLPGPDAAVGQRSRTFADVICERHLDAGFVLGSDGRTCRIVDECGHVLSVPEMLELCALGLPEEERAKVLCPPPADAAVPPTEADLLRLQRERLAPVAADSQGRCWFLNESPACDAIQTMAKALEVFSLSERLVSSFRRQPAPPRGSRR